MRLIKLLRKSEWSPYLGGALLGLLAVLSLLFTNRLLSASGGFESVGGAIVRAISPAAGDNVYWKFVMPAGIGWSVFVLLGIFAGALVSALAGGTFKWQAVSDEQWKRIFGPARWKRWLVLFVGAILLEYGAGIAGGCTSGLAISGGLQLTPSAFLFIMGMFASGIPTAMILYRRRY
ncbi:MAG: YeeE/YedE thiosulfate transporter family protein [Chloroflexi bacterium]|nr:YeeE/YedE thiosulfate transporter family protein [Chloroflexota bacterium]